MSSDRQDRLEELSFRLQRTREKLDPWKSIILRFACGDDYIVGGATSAVDDYLKEMKCRLASGKVIPSIGVIEAKILATGFGLSFDPWRGEDVGPGEWKGLEDIG